MELNNLTDLLKAVVTDLYTAEQQLSKALQDLSEKAETQELKDVLAKRIDEVNGHQTRLEEVCNQLEMTTPDGKENAAMRAILSGTEDFMQNAGRNEVKEAALIFAVQKIIHYKIAGYGSAREYAKNLGQNDIVELLNKTVEEEKKADVRLSEVAVHVVNKKAVEV